MSDDNKKPQIPFRGTDKELERYGEKANMENSQYREDYDARIGGRTSKVERKENARKNDEIKKLLRKLNGHQTPSEIWEEMVANDPSFDPSKRSK